MNIYPPGTPCWFDLGSPDVAASAAFYSDLLGWTAETVSAPTAGGYTTFQRDGQLAAAVAHHQIDTPYHRPHGADGVEGMPAIWTVYFSTDNADALTERVTASGGEVIMMPMEVMNLGRMAVFADPAGAPFAVWQPQRMLGAEIAGVPGSVVWVELVTPDADSVTEFYDQALLLSPGDTSDPAFARCLWQVGDTVVAGTRALDTTGAAQPHWAVTFGVTDCDSIAQRVVELGGRIENPPAGSPLGRRADLVDPHGAAFSVLAKGPRFPGGDR